LLPIEFARISQDGRLTLVVHPGSADQRTYWAVSGLASLDEARANLGRREGTQLSNIHYVKTAGDAADGTPAEVVEKCRDWVRQHPEVEAAIWTGLPSNWEKERGHAFSPEDAVRYIQELETRVYRAREYVQNTPSQIDTAVRREMRKRGWQDAELSAVLFDPDVAR
jgi:hypothetical protein